MSVKAMSYVWDTPYKGAKKLMLLAIADRCDDEGTCYPGVSKLAAKCSIKMRAAQALITELEKNDELIVQIQKGIETAHGKTNRYYMSGYRASIGLKTPTVGTRIQQITPPDHRMQNSASNTSEGMQNSASQGMQDLTSQGMQNSASNTSEYPSVKTSERKDKDSVATPRADKSHLENPDDSVRWPDLDEVSVIRLEREENSTQENIPTKRKTQTEQDKGPLSPIAAHPLSPQQQMVKALGEAFGVEATKPDAGKYAKVAKVLIESTIPCDEFKQYVAWVRREAKKSGDWKVTITSLSEKTRPSEYVQARNAYNAQQAIKKTSQVWLGQEVSKNAYNPHSDPAYATSAENVK